MNSYDETHLKLLQLIASGEWQRIEASQASEIRTLLVCGYIQVRRIEGGREEIAMLPDGHAYLERLKALKAIEPTSSRQDRVAS